MFVSTEIICLLFGSGMTLAIFHSLGITSSRNELIEESASPVLSLFCDNIRILSRSLVGRPFVIHSPSDHISLAAVCATTRCTARLSLY